MTIVGADHRCVDVGVAIDLRSGEKPDVDPAGLQPVVEHLGHTDHGVSGFREDAVTDRQWQPVGFGSDRARLVDEHDVGCVGRARKVSRSARQPDADEADVPIVQLTRGGDGHHLVSRVRRGHAAGTRRMTFSSIHARNVSRSLLIASHAV